MRKVLSFVLVLSLVLGSFGMAFAAPMSDVAGEDFEDAVNVLTELGVVNGYPDGTYRPDNIVTRAEMAVIVVSALGLADYATGTSSFSDMGGHWSNGFVAYATSLGVISGYPDGTFRPDKTVSYDEAATMLVAALGYNADSLVGTWPANFVTKAKVLGILDGIKAGVAGANRGDIATMTFQTLDQQIGKTNKDGDWLGTAGDDMLTRLGAAVYAVGAAAETAFVLDEDWAEEAVINVRDLIGAYVTAYVNDDGDIIAIKEVKSTFLTGSFDAVIGAWTEFSTDDKDYDKNLVVAPFTTEYFTNGVGVGAYALTPNTVDYKIAADVSGVKIKDIYSISEWTVDDSFLFEDGDLEDDNIAGNYFTLDDNDEIDLSSFALLGVDSLEDIDEDNVVYVYDDQAGSPKITRIEVGTETASGEVTRIKGSDYTIGGKVYGFSSASNAIATRPGVGDEIEMILDYDGDIFDYNEISGESDLYGIVLRTGVASEDPDSLGGSDAELELFLADGTKKTFVVEYDEIGIDVVGPPAVDFGIDEGTIPAVYNKNAGAADTWNLTAGDVIKYALNKDGEINSIEWIADAAPLTARGADTVLVGAAADLTAKGYYQGQQVANDALIMTYGSSFTTKAADYGVADRAKLLDSSIPANAFYVSDGGKIVFMYISDAATSADSVFGVLVDAEENNSDAGWGVDMLIDGVKVFINSNIDYQAGAMDVLYLVEYDVDGDVSLLTPQSTLVPGANDFDSSARTTAANTGTCTVSGNIIKVETAGDVFDIDGVASARTSLTLDSDVAVYKWSQADGVYKVAKISDIKGKADVVFFDTVDDDGVFDIVLIMDGATTLPY